MAATSMPTTYGFASAEPPGSARYLTPHILRICRRLSAGRVLDVGSGNGALCGALSTAGFDVVGCDPSEDGVSVARAAYPHLSFHRLGVYDDPAAVGRRDFDVVVSTEVIEHLYLPRALPRFAAQVLASGGHLVLTTPYHGYVKNLALAASGKLDGHFTALWDGGHIKFWSRATLSTLLSEEGYNVTGFGAAGRVPYLWKSMILIAQRR
jgi:2-polyprenyl-3-methyl-5-hydroxy-6-metoxy-1,4-benzoquinol methylase